VYIYIHTHTHIRTHTHTHTHTHLYTYVCIRLYIHTNDYSANTVVAVKVVIVTHCNIHADLPSRYVYTYISMYMYTNVHKYICSTALEMCLHVSKMVSKFLLMISNFCVLSFAMHTSLASFACNAPPRSRRKEGIITRVNRTLAKWADKSNFFSQTKEAVTVPLFDQPKVENACLM